ncbi:MAG: sigma-54 dependent transcriptional regulator [Candidatus Lernaella stagnicola]|nr:sigma-54 dependent transcriptional regulator [Candidatus Lernaella stagnicola]
MSGKQKDWVLVVDDDADMREALGMSLGRMGFGVDLAHDGMMAVEMLDKRPYRLVVTDVKMPRLDGMALLQKVREDMPDLPVLIITGFGTIGGAVEAMKNGATDYIVKPFNVEVLEKAVESVLTSGPAVPDSVRAGDDVVRIVTCNERMRKLLAIAAKIAKSDATVLINGESGTGKELFARLIHAESPRFHGPFVAVNCAAVPDNLLESELFGHEKGSFTGATHKKVGKFELAHKGTVLLDEIGEMPGMLQAKLLRVLQERKLDRVGGVMLVPIDIRVIATTNADLRALVEQGKFREDLFYRLNVIPLELPPLRERPDDIVALTDHYLDYFHAAGISDGARLALIEHDWKGNVRELRNVLERAALLSGNEPIGPENLILDGSIGSASNGARQSSAVAMSGETRNLKEIERRTILATLAEHGGNRTKTAEALGISIRTLRNKLNEYALDGFVVPKGGNNVAD